MAVIQILLADSQTLLRESLKCCIAQTADYAVAKSIGNAAELAHSDTPPDVVCISRQLQPEGGVAAIAVARSHWPQAKILFLTEPDDLAVCRSAQLAGCDGIVLMDSTPNELLDAISAVHRGESPMPQRLKDQENSKPRRADRTPLQSLSHRERQVLICLSRGMSYKQIAEKLFLGVKSIETYRARLFRKLNFDTKADLMRFAMDSGLMNPSMDI